MRIALSALLVIAAACGSTRDNAGGSPSGPGDPVATTAVFLQGSAFSPRAIVVAPGATVTFTNQDGFNHNVTFDNTAVTSISNWATGARTSTMPSAAATYAYRCTIHAGMSGSVKVQ